MNKNKFFILLALIFTVSIAAIFAELYSEKKTNPGEKNEEQEATAIEEEKDEPVLKYGMVVDSLQVETYEVVPNETFATILNKFNISNEQVYEITSKSGDIYDFSRIKAGNPYTVYCKKDSANSLQCLIYEASALDHYVIKLDTAVEVFKEQKKVDTTVKSIGGIINSSLYETLTENDASPELAVKLSEVFAWQVDFFRIMKGDNFKVIYEELTVDGKPLKTGKILAATFEQNGTTYNALNFAVDGKEEFFNEEGKNVRGFFLKSPLKYYRITSRYSKRRYHPVLKRYKSHLGTDYAASHGTPILATGKGKVVAASYTKGNGNYVKIKHNNTFTTQYLHMSGFAKGIRAGAWVNQGQVIGYVGSTGLATGPHVCYRFWKNGRQVDPRTVKYTEADPVRKENREAFDKYRDTMLEKLEQIPLNKEQKVLSSL